LIYLTRLQGDPLVLNSELLLLIERTPDTTLVLVSGQRIMVQETPEEIVERVIDYRRRIGMPEAFWNPDFASQNAASGGLADGGDKGAPGSANKGEEG
jgi:flagellar protein FlbD